MSMAAGQNVASPLSQERGRLPYTHVWLEWRWTLFLFSFGVHVARTATGGRARSCESTRAGAGHQLPYLALPSCLHTATWHIINSADSGIAAQPRRRFAPKMLRGLERGVITGRGNFPTPWISVSSPDPVEEMLPSIL